MEDLSNILWFLLIGASALISFIAKRNEEKKKKQNQPHEHNTTPYEEYETTDRVPTFDPFDPFETAPHRKTTHSIPKEEVVPTVVPEPLHTTKKPAQKQRGTAPLVSQAHQTTTDRLNSESYTPETHSFASENDEIADMQAPEVHNNGIMEGFELQKAVVWSEILKPKFSDESL